ncbi:hypothetical protein K4F52_008167 [Lecanicillium sp. MT-2017a]|nr:hypothetical protein K4F52_008167 [Lecanicillium sp. MT-2017a]
MVNRGRSGGCVTCKQRRVKCDEAKPECRTCLRLHLCCQGYNKPKRNTKLTFKDQSHKFRANNTTRDVGSPRSRDVVRAASIERQSPQVDVHHVKVLTLHRPSEPDTAVPFFLDHYASMGRDMGSTRGFFEMLVPACASQPQESALSLAVSALASEIMSVWRQDASSFRSPRAAYTQALARLRSATQDPIERSRPATVLAVLSLQMYENASAIYDLRQASITHHNGAASLLSSMDSDGMDGTVRGYLRQFMLHTEVSSAIRQKRRLKSTAHTLIGNRDIRALPENPSSTLDAIGASFAELQASYTEYMKHGGSTVSLERVLKEWRAEAWKLDRELLAWGENVPDHWRPQRFIGGRDFDSSIPAYQSICEVYPTCQIASIWNLWRIQRLLLAKMTLGSLNAFSDLSRFGFTYGDYLGEPTDLFACQQTLQEVVDSVCYSIPFHLGNRSSRVSLTDFTDPAILVPSYCSLKKGTGHDTNGLFSGMSKSDHRRHVIAQGPWRVMHPLSRLLTLFSEDDGEIMASLLRPGQRDWICDQFLRVATLLHLPSDSDKGMEKSESPGTANIKAEYLARETRKGAILMSGP